MRALDREKPELCRRPAARRKAADAPAGRHDAVARHDDYEGIAAERLPDRSRRPWSPYLRRDVAVGQRGAGRNRARSLVHATIERRHPVHVKPDIGEINRCAAKKRDDIVDGALNIRGRGLITRVWKSIEHSRPRFDGARLG